MDKNNEPKIEKLKDRGGLTATVNPGHIYIYDEKRPDYQDNPLGITSNPFYQLSRSLAEFDDTLARHLDRKFETELEKGVADGKVAFDQAGMDPMSGNKQAFKQWAEANPEQAGLNPYLRIGYESARLRNMQIDYKTQLNDAYTERGIANEADPKKVDEFVRTFDAGFREAHGLKDYDDPLILAEHFSPGAAEGKASIMSRHINDSMRANLERAQQEYSILFSKTITETMRNPGVNLSDPAARDRMTLAVAGQVTALAQEATSNGLPKGDVQKMVTSSLVALAKQMGFKQHGDYALDVLKNIDLGNGPLGQLPEIKGHIADMEKQFTAEEWQEQARAWEVQNHQWALQSRAWTLQAKQREEKSRADLTLANRMALSGQQVTPETLLKSGVAMENLGHALNAAKGLTESQRFVPVRDQNYYVDFYTTMAKAKQGKLSSDDVASISQRFGADAGGIVSAIFTEGDQRDAVFTSTMGNTQEFIFRQLSGTNSPMEKAMMMTEAGTVPDRILSALQTADEFSVKFRQAVDDHLAKDGTAKESGEHYREIVDRIAREVSSEILKGKAVAPTGDAPGVPQGQAPAAPTVSQFDPGKAAKPLFGSIEEYHSAVDAFNKAPSPDSPLMKIAKQAGVSNPDDLQAFMLAQEEAFAAMPASLGEWVQQKFASPYQTKQVSAQLKDAVKTKLRGQYMRDVVNR